MTNRLDNLRSLRVLRTIRDDVFFGSSINSALRRHLRRIYSIVMLTTKIMSCKLSSWEDSNLTSLFLIWNSWQWGLIYFLKTTPAPVIPFIIAPFDIKYWAESFLEAKYSRTQWLLLLVLIRSIWDWGGEGRLTFLRNGKKFNLLGNMLIHCRELNEKTETSLMPVCKIWS